MSEKLLTENQRPISQDTLEKIGRSGIEGVLEDVVRVDAQRFSGRKTARITIGPDLWAALGANTPEHPEPPVVSGVPVELDHELRQGVIFVADERLED